MPRVSRGADFATFAAAGASRTVLLRSESWRHELHPLLHLDPTKPQEAAEAGIDIAASATVISRGKTRISCVALTDVKRFEERCADKLKPLGESWKGAAAGAKLVGVKDPSGRVSLGYAIKGRESCSVASDDVSVEPTLTEAATWLGKPAGGPAWATLSGLDGAAYLLMPDMTLALRPQGLTLETEGKLKAKGIALSTGGPSPYAALPSMGMMTLRLRAAPGAMTPALEMVAQLLAELCPACELGPFLTAARALGPALSGNAVLVVQKAKVEASLRTQAGRFFALKLAALAEAVKPDVARQTIDALASVKGAKRLESGDGVSLLLREGQVLVGQRDGHVFFSNDAPTLEALRSAVGVKAAGKQAHGAELSLDPALLADALSQVPLLDAVQSQELAGLLAAGTELGPLLLSTERLHAFANPAGPGAARGVLTFQLKPPPVATDAGRDR